MAHKSNHCTSKLTTSCSGLRQPVVHPIPVVGYQQRPRGSFQRLSDPICCALNDSDSVQELVRNRAPGQPCAVKKGTAVEPERWLSSSTAGNPKPGRLAFSGEAEGQG